VQVSLSFGGGGGLRGQDVDKILMGALVLLTGFVLLVLPFLAVRFLSRRLAPPPDTERGAPPPGGWECARCASGLVSRLPGDRVSPHPSYQCGECGALMRPRGSGPVYGLVLVISLALLAGGAYVVLTLLRPDPQDVLVGRWTWDDGGEIEFFPDRTYRGTGSGTRRPVWDEAAFDVLPDGSVSIQTAQDRRSTYSARLTGELLTLSADDDRVTYRRVPSRPNGP